MRAARPRAREPRRAGLSGISRVGSRPNRRSSCDTAPTLTVRFHSVASGRVGELSTSISRSLLTVEMHRVSSDRGRGYSFPNRRGRPIDLPSLTVGMHSVPSCDGWVLSTAKSASSFACVPLLTIETHRVFSVWLRPRCPTLTRFRGGCAGTI